MMRTKILVVDDEPEIRALLCRLLSRQGYEVTEAGDGLEALSLCRGGPSFDLLLTDIVMPHMDGVELARHVCSLFPSTRVLYMSAKCDIENIERQVGKPGFGFIRKPFQLARLCRIIHEQLHPEPSRPNARKKAASAPSGDRD